MSDFIVIGGGIAGISAAARLSEHGVVTVLEQEEALGYHASGRSAAMFAPGYGAPANVALNEASAEYHHEANGGYLSPRGFMLLAGPQEAEAFAADVADLGLTELTMSDALSRVPILNTQRATLAAIDEESLDLDTDRMIQDFAKVVRGAGGQVLTRQTVIAITRVNGLWQVRCGDAVFEAPKLVNAAGPWVDQIAKLAGIRPIGIRPLRRSMARLPAPGGHDVTGWPMLMGVGESWYAKPDAGKLLVSPADEDPAEPHDAWADDMVLAEGLARYEEFVTEPVTRIESNWAGLRSFAPDKLLVLGPEPDEPSFIWSAGQGGYGFQTAPAASQLVADLAVGRAPSLAADVVAALNPARLR